MTAEYYYTFDHLGSVREMLNSSGTIVSRLSYDPNGNTTVVSGTTLPTMGFAEMYWHQPSGEYFTKWRIYDSKTATWRSKDPIGEDGGVNLYGYVDNEPLNSVDPLGLDPKVYPGPGATPAQVAAVTKALNRVLSTPSGQDALKVLRLPGTPELPIVVFPGGGPNRSLFPTDPLTGEFEPPVIIINPDCKEEGSPPMEAVIAHELAHAALGEPGYNGAPYDPRQEAQEAMARTFENNVRKELGLPPRPSGHPAPGPIQQ